MGPTGTRLRATTCLVAFALILGFYLRLKAADHVYLSPWDEAFHAMVAKNLASHPLTPTLYDAPLLEYDFKDWTGNHVWLHKPPVPLWLMALSIAVAGDAETVFRIPSVVLGTLSIFLAFLLGKELFGEEGRWAGTLAALFLAVNPLLIRLTAGIVPTDHIDLITSFFVQLTVLPFAVGARRGSVAVCALAGACLGLAFLSKSMPALLPLAVALPLFWRERRPLRETSKLLLSSLLGFAVIAFPWKAYCALRWPQEFWWESRYTFMHLFNVIDGHAHPASWYIDLIPLHYGGLKAVAYAVLLVAVGWCAAVAVKRRDLKLGAVLVWALLPYLVFSATVTKLYSFVSTSVPAFALLAGFAAASLPAAWKRVRDSGKSAWAARLGVLSAGVLWGVYFTGVTAERLAADYKTCPWEGLYNFASFRTAMKRVGEAPGKKVVFNVGSGMQVPAMYYADCPAYPIVPSNEKVRELLDQGYGVYILVDEGKLTLAEWHDRLRKSGVLERTRPVHIKGGRPTRKKLPHTI